MENVFLVKKMYLMKKIYFLFGCNIENASEIFFFNVELTWKLLIFQVVTSVAEVVVKIKNINKQQWQ